MIFRLLLALVALAPLPFASAHGWSAGLLATGAGVLLIAWAGSMLRRRQVPAVGLRRVWPAALLFALALAWAGVQSLTVTPESWHHPLWREAGAALGIDISGRVSLDPAATLDGLARLLAYAAIFWLALQYGRSPARVRLGLGVVAAAGGAYAAYGLALHVGGSETVLWLDKVAYRGDLTATFINRNAYAAYAGLGLLATTTLIVAAAMDGAGALPARERARRLIVWFGRRGWLLALAWAVTAAALLLSHSRGGLASTAIGLVTLAGGLALAHGGARPRRLAAATVGVVAVLLLAVAGSGTDVRLTEAGRHAPARLAVYGLTIEATEAAPLTGTGLGSFPEMFQIHRRADMPTFYLRAHNSYLENALELGIPAALCLTGALAWLAARCAAGIRERRRDAAFPALGVAASALAGSHALVDFSLQMPAVAATYALLMGLACAQSWSSRAPAGRW